LVPIHSERTCLTTNRNTSFGAEAALLLQDALKGVWFLHQHGFIHGDLKPQNIAIHKGTRAVLLDIGTALPFAPAETLYPTPGNGGTVPYLAPEREMTTQPSPALQNRRADVSRVYEIGFDCRIDVWAMGVVFYQLKYKKHPWNLAHNAWREKYETLQPEWDDRYEVAMTMLREDEHDLCKYFFTSDPPTILNCSTDLSSFSS
jgi:serine/threonine protein kinase